MKQGSLTPVDGLVFHDTWNGEEIHKYRYTEPDSNCSYWIPHSITKVVRNLSDYEKKCIEETKHIWEPRGNFVHEQMDNFANDRAVDLSNYAEWIEPAIAHPFFKSWAPIATEYSVIDRRYLIAGRFDGLYICTNKNSKYYDKLCLLDFKTQGSKTSTPNATVWKQLGGYCNLLDQCKKLVVPLVAAVWIRPGRTVVDIREAEDPISSYLAARSLYLESQSPF